VPQQLSTANGFPVAGETVSGKPASGKPDTTNKTSTKETSTKKTERKALSEKERKTLYENQPSFPDRSNDRTHNGTDVDQLIFAFMEESGRPPFTGSQQAKGLVPTIREDLEAFIKRAGGVKKAEDYIRRTCRHHIEISDPLGSVYAALTFAKKALPQQARPKTLQDFMRNGEDPEAANYRYQRYLEEQEKEAASAV
jgi:hypothetical protein